MTPPVSSQSHIAALLARPDPICWVFAGDSITHGALHTMGWRDYPELFGERVRWECRRMRDAVIKTGVSGWRVGELDGDLEWSVLRYRPDVVSIALGANDCAAGPAGLAAFEAGLRQIMRRVRQSLPEAAFILHTPIRILPADTLRFPYLESYVEVIRRVAKDTDALLVDHFEDWRQAFEDNTAPYRLSDAVHPNEIGHRVMVRLLLQRLGLWGEDGLTSRLLIV